MRTLSIMVALLVSLAATADDFGRKGPYQLAESTIAVTRPDQSQFNALLFYPADRTATSMPAIAFAHGFLSPPEVYRATCRHLASWGYVVIASRSGLEPFPNHADYARDLSFCLTWIEQANENTTSPLFGRVDTNSFGITGHSMGGGASLLAAAEDPRIIAVAPMAAADTRPSAIEASALITAPLLFITGSQDSFVPNPFHTRPMFDQTAAPSVWIDIKGGYHCGFILIKLPEAVCDEGSISRQNQLAQTHPLLTAFFELNLKGNQKAWNTIWGSTIDLDRKVTVRRKTVATLSPDRTQLQMASGGTAGYSLAIKNTGLIPRSFTMEATSGITSVVLSPGITPVLQPGESTSVNVSVTSPKDVRNRRDTIQIRAIATDNSAEGGDYSWGLIRITR